MKSLRTLPLVLIFAACLQQGDPDPEHGSVLTGDGINISYTVYGEGETALVFVHCWCCDQGYWREQVDTFSRDYTVVTLDLAAHGKSGSGRQDYTMQAFGMDVEAVVNHLELDRIILIGHSLGGYVVLAAAQQLKEKTLAVIGVDTYQAFQRDIPDSLVASFLEPFRKDFYNTTIGFVMDMFPPGADPMLVREISEDMAEGPEDAAVSAMINNISTDPVDLLSGLNMPIYSINSRMYPVDVENNQKLYPDFQVRFMEGVGHFIQLEDPGTFNRHLRNILREIIG